MINIVFQKLKDDCGIAALAMALDVDYDSARYSFNEVTGRHPGPTSFGDLISVLKRNGFQVKKCWWSKSTKKRIVRCRMKRGDKHSHWVLLDVDGKVYCPFSGIHESREVYPMNFFSYCLEFY